MVGGTINRTVGTMPSEAQQNAAFISATSSSKAYFFEPKEPERSRLRGAAGVTELVKRRGAPLDRLEIGLRRRNLHIVVCGHVEGPAVADAESMPLALISASTLGSIGPGSRGGAMTTSSSGRPSHCARLKTVKRSRNGIACASLPVSLSSVSSRRRE